MNYYHAKEMIENLAATVKNCDFENTANFVFMKRLNENLIVSDLHPRTANLFVATMKIMLPEKFHIDEPDLFELTLYTYTMSILKIFNVFKKSYLYPDEMLLATAKDMSITLE